VRIVFTKTFADDYQYLPHNIQLLVDKSLLLLADNPKHPSLRIKRVQGTREKLFEGRVSRDYRFTFQIDANVYLLRTVGPHNHVLKSP
jgi:mRNA-degrading endonuclease RelE of RelBE toxin-antitoxin system